MKIMKLIFVIAITLSSIEYVFPNQCCDDSLDSFNKAQYPGYWNRTNAGCISDCNKLRSAGLSSHTAVVINGGCLCINDNITSLVHCVSSLPSCDILTSTCEIKRYSLLPLGNVMISYLNWSVPSPLYVNSSFKIDVNIIPKNPGVQYTFDNGKKNRNITESTDMRYYSAGYNEWKIIAMYPSESNLTVESQQFVYISENVRSVHFTEVRALETNAQNEISLYISSGTNMTVQVKDGNSPANTYFADVYEWFIGYYSEELGSRLNDGIYVVPSMVFDENGAISKVFCSYASGGGEALNLLILRPICPTGTVYSISSRVCVPDSNPTDGIDLVTERTRTEATYTQYWTAPTLKLVQSIVLTKSLEVIFMDQYKFEVKKHDMIGYVQSPQTATVQFNNKIAFRTYKLSTSFGQSLGSVFESAALEGTDGIPLIKIHYSKWFGHRMMVTPPTAGEHTITAEITSPNDGILETKHYKVQDRISGLSLLANYPKEAAVGAYDVDRSVVMKASVTEGTDVEYVFTVKELQLQQVSMSGEATFGINQTGIFTVEVHASNLINELNGTSRQFKVMESIQGMYLTVSKLVISTDEVIDIQVNIINGTNVTLEIDYGDGTSPFIDTIASAQHGVYRNASHSYTTYSLYTVKAKVRNSVTPGVWETFSSPYNDTAVVRVQGLNIESTPKVSSLDNTVSLLVGFPWSVTVELVAGSSSVFHINWGDGQTDVEDQSEKDLLVSFTIEHRYQTNGKFKVNIIASNAVYKFAKNISVEVVSVGGPKFLFAHGTETSRVRLFRKDRLKVTGLWTIFNFTWVNTIGEYKMKHWEFLRVDKDNTETLIKKVSTGFYPQYVKVMYNIPEMQEQGNYNLRLTMTFRDMEFVYTEYFTVFQSRLVAKIHNEQFQAIPFQRVDAISGNQVFHHFHLNASKSHDPDDPMSLTDGIHFRWHCRLVSNEYMVNKSLNTRRNHTHFQYNSTMCRNTDWMDDEVISADVAAVFNTEMFLRNIEYEFKLTITKGNRTRSTTQIVHIAPGTPPEINLKYVELSANSGEKINMNNLLAFELAGCNDFPFDTQFSSIWTASVDSPPYTDVIPPITTTGNCYSHDLIVPPNTLLPSTNYTFTLAIKHVGGLSQGIYKIKRRTSETPYNGKCVIEGRQNITAPSNITVSCTGWETQDWPIKYKFYQTPKPNTKYSIREEDSSPFLNFVPAVGDESQSYLNKVTVAVLNRYRQYEVFFLDIYVLPPTEKPSIESVLEMVPNNPTEISNAVIMMMSVIKSMQSTPSDAGDRKYGEIVVEKLFGHQQQEERERELKRKEMEKFVKKITSSIANSTDINIDGMTTATRAIEDIISYPDAVSEETMESSTNALDLILTKVLDLMSDNGWERHKDIIGRQEVEEFAKIMTNALTALLRMILHFNRDVAEYIAMTSKLTEEQKQEALKNVKEKHTKMSVQTRKIAESLSTLLAKNQLPGEKDKEVITEHIDIIVRKVSTLSELANTSITFSGIKTASGNITVSESGFLIGNPHGTFNESDFGKPVNVLVTIFKTDIYPGIEGSENIVSEQPSLEFRTADNREVTVKNATSPIIVRIKNNVEKLKAKNISLYMPGKLKFHSIKLPKSCSLQLRLNAFDDFANDNILYVYIQYGKPPSRVDYDIKLTLNRSGVIRMTVNNGNVLINQTVGSINTSTVITESRHAKVHLASDQTLVLWDFHSSTYGYINNSNLYLGLIYEGKMPPLTIQENPYTYDQLEFRGMYNFSLVATCASCSFVDTEAGKNLSWSSRGCRLIPNRTSLRMSVCECNHLTTFGSFFVEPNALKPFSFALLKESYVLMVAVATILLLYLIGLIFTRRADQEDTSKIGVSPLPDNKPEDKYLYEITVNTGSGRNAGTKSHVCFQIKGDLTETGTRVLVDTARQTFQRSSTDVFVMATSSSLGEISHVRIWHDNSGGGWYLRSIEVIDLQTNQKFMFIASRWLAVEKHDGQIDVSLSVANQLDLNNFSYVFASKTRHDLSDAHIWFSIYARPPRSSFTRCQRLSVAISLLLTEMTTSCMFYGAIPTDNPTDENRISNFAFRWEHVYIASVSALITVPINLILAGLFRSIRYCQTSSDEVSKEYNSNYKNESIVFAGFESLDHDGRSSSPESLVQSVQREKHCTHITINDVTLKDKNRDKANTKKKEPFYLPRWALYPTWFVCLCTIFGPAFMVVWYGMSFGNKKSLQWIASVSIGVIQDILLIEPMQVFIVALFAALVYKKLNDKERSELEKQVRTLAKDENWLHDFATADGNIFTRTANKILEPPNNEKLRRMRELRLTELKMRAISRELSLYLLFTCIVFLWGFMTRDYLSYYQTIDLEQTMHLKTRPQASNKTSLPEFPYEKCHTQHLIWDCIEDMILPELYPQKWYNLSDRLKDSPDVYEFPGPTYLSDVYSKIITGVRIRQVRVNQGSCRKANDIREYISNQCIGDYSTANELKRDFAHNWSVPTEYKIKMNPRDMPWRYQPWHDLDGYPMLGELNTYYGGGYVVELFPKWNNKKILETLREQRWTDRQTRAIIVEFAVYNANTNYFDSIAIIFELPPAGGVIHHHYVYSFNLYRYTNEYAFFTVLCELLFIIFMLLFMIREARVIYKEKWNYFTEFWNLVEFSNIVFSVLAVVFNFYRVKLAKDLLSDLPDKAPNTFINFQFAAYWDFVFTYIVALVCFFITLKFIKLLRFNRRISMLSSTLKRAWYPLLMFGIIFGIVLIAVTFSATIIFSKALYGYRDNFKSFTSIISLLLGKFSYHQFDNTNRFLGPVFFFSFNVMVNWIIMNMYISILNDAFAEVRNDFELQDNDYKMVDYMVNNLKGWIGMQNQTNEELFERALQKKQEQEEKLSHEASQRDHKSPQQQYSRLFGLSSDRSVTSLKREMLHHHQAKCILPAKHPSETVTSKVFSTEIPSFLAVDEDMDEEVLNETVGKLVKCVTIIHDQYNRKTECKKKKGKSGDSGGGKKKRKKEKKKSRKGQ